VQAKDEEWRRVRDSADRSWRQQKAENLAKSLDYQVQR
jgi:histone deacetylase complex regulatory component SIN3